MGGSRTQQALSRLEESGRNHLSGHPQGRGEFHRTRFLLCCFGYGRRDTVVRGGRSVHGRGFPRSQGQETLPHRQCRLGSLRNHHEIRRRTRSRAFDVDGPVPKSGTSDGGQTSTGATGRAQPAAGTQELPTLSASTMNNSNTNTTKKEKKNFFFCCYFPPIFTCITSLANFLISNYRSG